MVEETGDLSAIGEEILRMSRNELYLSLPYLDSALCALAFAPSQGITGSVATNGETLYYDGGYLAERYLRGSGHTNRIYLHVILHCMLRHLRKKEGRDPELWDLACDMAVESILDGLDYACLGRGNAPPLRQRWYSDLRREMPVLTAEGIYRTLLRNAPEEYERARLQREFFADDHGLWSPQSREDKERSERQDKNWQGMSERTQTGLETVLSGQAVGGEAVYEQIRVANRDDVDYRAFLRRFAVHREIMAVDGDAFDYIFYAYGLQLYGNMPLVEPPETREEKRIEDFVIAVDTSMSTSGETVRQFLACTYAILRSTGTFTRKVNIRIIQCDDQVRSDTVIHDLEELREYMENFQLTGGSATDFRPVFAHVAALQEQGAFVSLRGLLYFADGMGIYPQKRPPYETAFILLTEPPVGIEMPPWAIRLVLGERTLEDAALAEGIPMERDADDLAELPDL